MAKRKLQVIRCPQCKRPRSIKEICTKCVEKNKRFAAQQQANHELLQLIKSIFGRI